MKDANNKILVASDDSSGAVEARYVISDLGGSLGKTGGFISRSRNKPSDYVKSEFVKGVRGNIVDFHYGGKNGKLFDNITVKDAKWLAGWLRRLSDNQIKDAFRAANYTAEEVEMLAVAVRARINTLANLPGNSGR